MNHGHGQQSRRWYKLCFVPTSSDSSDDSDTESVVIAPSTPTQTSTWQQSSPPYLPPSPPNPEPQINWSFPPPPPPPPSFFLLSPPLVRLQFQATNLEPQINRHSPPPPPPPPPFSLLSPPLVRSQFQATNPEPQTNWQSSQQPPPPSPPLERWDEMFPLMDNVSPSVIEQRHPEDDQSVCLRIPDSVINAIRRVRISELHERDKLSHCPICMEEFKLDDKACQLPCKHTYKFECILRWLNSNKTCPICRLRLDGWEGQGSSYNIGDDDDNNSLDLEPPILPPVIITNSLEDLLQFSPHSQVTEDVGGDNSADEAEYDSACDYLGDSYEDGEIVSSNYQSNRSSQI